MSPGWPLMPDVIGLPVELFALCSGTGRPCNELGPLSRRERRNPALHFE
jgi:hypothetical protein